MKLSFQRVILYARQYRMNQDVHESLLRVVNTLQALPVELVVDADTAALFPLSPPVIAHEAIGQKKDLMLVVGGDGSILSAARLAVEKDVPVIGVNRGRLGFLTDINPQVLEQQIMAVLTGHFQEESRAMLQTDIHSELQSYFHAKALNDVVLGRGEGTHLIEFDVYINQQFVSHYRADGMIIATPTGSTAYALSAGGPIMHPGLNALVLVPMFSHSLSSRPLVIDGESQIDLHIHAENETNLRISCDGHESRVVKPGQIVSIQKNNRALRLLHPTEYQYYDTLRSKLGWESKYQG